MSKHQRHLRSRLMKAQECSCAYCRREMVPTTAGTGRQPRNSVTLEHILPQVYGGRNQWIETIAVCASCNQARAHRPLTIRTLWNVMQMKPPISWIKIIKLHIINLHKFHNDPRGYTGRFDHRKPRRKQGKV